VQQAEELIPHLRTELGRLRPAYRLLRDKWEIIAEKNNICITDEKMRELCTGDDEVAELLEEVEGSLERIRLLGVECKGIEEGLFDFPCLLEDRVVYLCWKETEMQITHWHELDAGYVGRKPLLEATKRDHEGNSGYLN